MIRITSPTSIFLGKKYHLNLNNYRNWHFQISNKVKQEYQNIMLPQLRGLRLQTPIKITFVLYKASKRKQDRSNVLSIVEKFFCDSLVHYGCLPDDDDSHIISTDYRTGEIDKDNPRVEIYIETKKWHQN